MKKKAIVEASRVAQGLGLDPSTMSRWITTGRIKGVVKNGRSWYFTLDDLVAALERIPAQGEKLPLLDEAAAREAAEQEQAKKARRKAILVKKITEAIEAAYEEAV